MDSIVPHSNWREATPLLTQSSNMPAAEGEGFKLNLGDLLFIFYRQKWKILICSLLGLAGAAAVYLATPRQYKSTATLMVKYVAERQAVGPTETQGQIKLPISGADTVVNAELEILNSRDLAKQVAMKFGPERILAKLGGGNNLESATSVVKRGIKTNRLRGGNVIEVTFEHPDLTIVQPVLEQLREAYIKKHYEIHQALGNLNEYEVQRDEAKSALKRAEDELAVLMKENGVYSLEDAKKAVATRVAKAEQDVQTAETELEIQRATLQLVREQSATNTVVALDPLDREQQREQYKMLQEELAKRQKQAQDWSLIYKDQSGMVQPFREQIADLQKRIKQMAKDDPSLAMITPNTLGTTQAYDPAVEAFRIQLKEKTLSILTNQMQQARDEEARIWALERQFGTLQKARQIQDKKYTYYASTLDETKIDTALGASRNSGITDVQSPTPAERVVVSLLKRMLMAAGAGVALGVALALFLECVVDQSIKRPVELQRMLPVPVYLSIPKGVRGSQPAQLTQNSGSPALLLAEGSGAKALSVEEAPGASPEFLQPYFGALRDRVLNRFENLARKPKLVGVCGCADGTGVTMTAAGLAAALSEAGDLKVLLVDMKPTNRLRQTPATGRNSCSLTEALEEQKRQSALIAPNLYLATGGGTDTQQVSSPTKFTKVVPHLNASDFDYIVFDLPPVDPVSVTPRLAKHMDLTLLVVQAEKEHRNAVKQAGSLLLEFTPNVAVVLHDVQANLPPWLQQAI